MAETNALTQAILGTIEELTGYVGVIQSDHAYIHDGIAYNVIYEVTTGGTVNIGFKTPASSPFIHWRPSAVTSSANNVKHYLYEGDTYSGGANITPVNLNRLSSRASEMQVFKTAVTSAPSGTIIQAGQIGTSGSPQARSGGGGGANEERVLKQDTNYVFQIVASGATTVIIELFWYEEGKGLDG